jgi:DNA (cytosine-5)-methyltransferase 1
MIKVLNLYAGIGGNRKLWTGVRVTAVEQNPDIARIYKKSFPKDEMIVGDAHKYLLDNFKKFDFIWSSPPCQSHSKLMAIHNNRDYPARFPDLKLYEEIIFLKHNFKGKWLVENVNPYYTPLVAPSYRMGRHLFWSNFQLQSDLKISIDPTRINNIETLAKMLGMEHTEKIKLAKGHPEQIIRNCVHPEIGRALLLSSMGKTSYSEDTLLGSLK